MKISCYVDVWMGDNNGNTVSEAPALADSLQFQILASDATKISLKDSQGGVILSPKPIVSHAGHPCWNLDDTYLEYSGGSSKPQNGQDYTHAVWVYWRTSDKGYRTLFRGNKDHSALIQENGKNLGMFSNRNGGFQDSGYDIDRDMKKWQLVIVVGKGNSANSWNGTSTFYTAAEGDSTVQFRGTANRVVSGTEFYRLGWLTQGPGKVAAAYMWTRCLTVAEMHDLLRRGVGADAKIQEPAWKIAQRVQVHGQDKMHKCKIQNANTAVMDVDYGTPADLYKCHEAHEKIYPGSPTFVNTEYSAFKDYIKEVTKCLGMSNSQSFEETAYGASTCSTGYERIVSEAVCKQAGNLLSKTWSRTASWHNIQKGCFSHRNNHVWFNTHANPSAHGDYSMICKKIVFAETKYGAGECMKGFEVIKDEKTCKMAGEQLNKKWSRTSSWHDRQKGCFSYAKHHTWIWFNTHASPTAPILKDHSMICKESA